MIMVPGAQASRWRCRHAFTWDEVHVQFKSNQTPYGTATERILVFSGPRGHLRSRDASGRSDVLNGLSVLDTRPGMSTIVFWKPLELSRCLGKNTPIKERPFVIPVAPPAICPSHPNVRPAVDLPRDEQIDFQGGESPNRHIDR